MDRILQQREIICIEVNQVIKLSLVSKHVYLGVVHYAMLFVQCKYQNVRGAQQNTLSGDMGPTCQVQSAPMGEIHPTDVEKEYKSRCKLIISCLSRGGIIKQYSGGESDVTCT
jgi:hypothetical protein